MNEKDEQQDAMTDSRARQSSGPARWMPSIPAPLQRLFDSVPLVTYPPNELPCRSPGETHVPTLNIFTSERDAARGSPSFNPACLKWQAFFRMAGIQFYTCPSTNHASPTGSLPFLLPPISSISPAGSSRLDPNHLLPIPASRLEAYATQHGALCPASPVATDAESQVETRPPQSQTYRRQAYQTLVDGPIRDAWLYSLYLSPKNESVLWRWYIDPASRSRLVQNALLRQLKAAARAEIASSPSPTTMTRPGWKFSGNLADMLTWVFGRKTVIDPQAIYSNAREAFEALEILLYRDGADGAVWFFDSPHPTLFDAAVFSYVYPILHDELPASSQWLDDELRSIVLSHGRLVEHTQKILQYYWKDQQMAWLCLCH